MLFPGSVQSKVVLTTVTICAGVSCWTLTVVFDHTLMKRWYLQGCKCNPDSRAYLRVVSNNTSGGGCTKDAEGNLILVRDQGSDDSAVSSLINSMNLKVPVGLIIGKSSFLQPE